jgi:hypothetical protein
MLPPGVVPSPGMVVGLLWEIVPPASSASVPALPEIGVWMDMLPAALRVSCAAVFQEIGMAAGGEELLNAFTVMFPGCVPVGFEVVTVTNVPRLSAVLMVETSTFGYRSAARKRGGSPLQFEDGGELDKLLIVTLELGSSSHCPGVPFGAAALTEAKAPISSGPSLDVSTTPAVAAERGAQRVDRTGELGHLIRPHRDLTAVPIRGRMASIARPR